MGGRGIKGVVFFALIAALAVVVLQLSNYSFSPPDNRGIGGDWKPYALDAHSKMDNYFRVSGDDGINTMDSDGNNQVYYILETANLLSNDLSFSDGTISYVIEEDGASYTIAMPLDHLDD